MTRTPEVAILYPGSPGGERAGYRFSAVGEELRRLGARPRPTPYRDDAAAQVRRQLEGVDGVLVWVNPLEDGRTRTVLDGLLRELAGDGVFVSAHPDVIMQMGTKDVLAQTQNMRWSSGDIHTYRSLDDMRHQLPALLAGGASRVLKQHRGNGGHGVWRIALAEAGDQRGSDPMVRVLHALRGSPVRELPLGDFAALCEPYFADQGHMIDQPFEAPGAAGMIRCYMTHAEVVGFGQQHVTALLWSEDGLAPPAPEPRLYYPESEPRFQTLKSRMETEWIPRLQRLLDVRTEALPVIWDADFLCSSEGGEGCVLCEINVSCVAPFPDSARPRLVEATLQRIHERR